jgi:hypothetical protein
VEFEDHYRKPLWPPQKKKYITNWGKHSRVLEMAPKVTEMCCAGITIFQSHNIYHIYHKYTAYL